MTFRMGEHKSVCLRLSVGLVHVIGLVFNWQLHCLPEKGQGCYNLVK